jgi:tRNA(Ile)-lysidine synthase
LTELEQKVADFIAAERLLPVDVRVLLAVSGGADSTALLHVMAALRAYDVLPVEIHCAHINHQLRGDEAQREEDFVVDQCRKLGLQAITKRIDVLGYARAKKLSIETAARILRIDGLLEIAARQNCTCIATAHQKNDNAETILHRLIRGTGFRGLCGIWPTKEFLAPILESWRLARAQTIENEALAHGGNLTDTNRCGVRFIRPLLCVKRDEIIQYLSSRNLKWCTDKTNEDCTYKRNFIRHRLLPALQKNCSGCLVSELSELANASRGFYRLICRSADAVLPNVATAEKQMASLDLDRLGALPTEVKVEIIRRALVYLNGGEQEITERHYSDILRLSENKSAQLPGGIEVHRQGTKIVFVRSQKKTVETGATEPVALKVPGATKFVGMHIEAETFEYNAAKFKKFRATKSNFVEWFDLDSIEPPVMVRFRRHGDRFWPLGMAGEKKVGKFLTGTKASTALRQKMLVIADSRKIIWLFPIRISEEAKVTGHTRLVLRIRVRGSFEDVG